MVCAPTTAIGDGNPSARIGGSAFVSNTRSERASRAFGPAAARHDHSVVIRRVVPFVSRIIAFDGDTACEAWVQIDGDDVRTRAAYGPDRNERHTNTERRSRATPHFAPPNYGCWMANISGKNEELVNAAGERASRAGGYEDWLSTPLKNRTIAVSMPSST